MEKFFDRFRSLQAGGTPFAVATVVRAERPTSARPGMKAIILADGTLEGWVGGSCAHPVVVREAQQSLRDGTPRLISLSPEGQEPSREGITHHTITCHSGGTLEIYIEPVLPSEQLVVVGRTPVARALAALGAALGRHVVVAEYVSLVASRKRAESVFAYLARQGATAEAVERVKVPAGLDIGALTPEEIAVSIMAEIIQARRRRPVGLPDAPARAAATDPVCGMTVEVATARYTSDYDGVRFYFCSSQCKDTFDRDPAPYAAVHA
ncbi:MAG: XdhC family protein [Armatimonadetes bacterium]|nr:XdhC family protein [Armatimonadota bacterium]